MIKKLKSLVVVHTHTHRVSILQKKIKHITINGINILFTAMFLLLCLFTGNVQARAEVPSNLIQEKESAIQEIILGAGEGITLTRTYVTGTESIDLTWTAVAGAEKYNVYQTKAGEAEKLITSTTATYITLNKSNAGIKDEAAPTAPVVNATQTADGLGNNITITPSTDNGTTYEHYIQPYGSTNGGYLVFMVDYGKGNSGWVSNAKTAMKEIGRELISRNVQIGIVVNGGDSDTASWDFTNNINTFEKNIDSMYRITHGSMAERNASCKTYAK